jgi:hypothetical protein
MDATVLLLELGRVAAVAGWPDASAPVVLVEDEAVPAGSTTKTSWHKVCSVCKSCKKFASCPAACR